jgi:hypothetical protein
MSFTTLQPSDNRTRALHYGLVEDTQVTHDDVHEKYAKRPQRFALRGASVTVFAMIASYVLGTKTTPPLRRFIVFEAAKLLVALLRYTC